MPDRVEGAGGIDTPIHRRTFIAAASGLALAAALPGATALAKGGGSGGGPALGQLSVGYVDGSDEWPDLDDDADRSVLELGRVVPATGLASGEPGLAGAILGLRVHGLVPGGTERAFVGLDVTWPATGSATYPYQAWSMRTEGVPYVANRLTVPVAVAGDPAFGTVVRSRTVAGSVSAASASFGLGKGRSLAKLRRGAYLLALDPGTWDSARSIPPPGDPGWSPLASILVTVDA